MNEATLVLCLERGLEGDTEAITQLVRELAPVVHCRVARALVRRYRQARGRELRQEVEDLTQDVFVALFAHDARALRQWDAKRGLSLPNFVGLLAEREVASILRSGVRSPWTEDPTAAESIDATGSRAADPERSAASRELARTMLERLRERLSPLGMRVFELLWRDQKSVAEACAELGMSADALYAWRTRIRQTARDISEELGVSKARRNAS